MSQPLEIGDYSLVGGQPLTERIFNASIWPKPETQPCLPLYQDNWLDSQQKPPPPKPAATLLPPEPPKNPAARLLPSTSGERKKFPMGTGLLDYFPDALVLLRHKCAARMLGIWAAQYGHRDSVLTSATSNRRRMVAIEFGMWRSGRKGGASGSVTLGYGRCREQRGGTRS
jgi:hypothetical protein